jgi:predicted nucleic acid-binding protein
MIRIFLDSSVLFSAIYSAKGHSRDLLMMAARDEIIIAISQLVLEETRSSLSDYSPETVVFFDHVIETIPFEYVRPTKRDVIAAAKHTVLKDAPIIAAAKKARTDFLVTLDKKHLLEKPELVAFAGIPIVTPKEVLEILTNK